MAVGIEYVCQAHIRNVVMAVNKQTALIMFDLKIILKRFVD